MSFFRFYTWWRSRKITGTKKTNTTHTASTNKLNSGMEFDVGGMGMPPIACNEDNMSIFIARKYASEPIIRN
jgi:hypothetical protein